MNNGAHCTPEHSNNFTETPDDFFVSPNKTFGLMHDLGYMRAMRTCAGCPLRNQCLLYARSEGIPFGIFGGEDEQQRWNYWHEHGGMPQKFYDVIDSATTAVALAYARQQAVYEKEAS